MRNVPLKVGLMNTDVCEQNDGMCDIKVQQKRFEAFGVSSSDC